MLIQKWDKRVEGELQKAEVYYSILSVVRELDLSTRQIELLAFTSYRGTIASLTSKREFSRRYGSSVNCVNNMISRLTRLNFLNKDETRIFVNPAIDFDFSQEMMINIRLNGIERADN